MASSSSAHLAQFKCFSCSAIPTEEQVNKCSRGHTNCLKCSSKKAQCSCLAALMKMPNPLLTIVQKTTKMECTYKDRGCTWIVSESDAMENHCSECKFRPFKCVGAEFGFWTCDWAGMQHDFGVHMSNEHRPNGPFFTHYHVGDVDFHATETRKKFNLIDAFNKKFVFLYMSHTKNPNVVFIIYLLGRKCDAEKYLIDFELKDGLRKVKFNEICYSDAHNIKSIINDHRCFVLPKTMVESYVKENRLEFRFVIKKKMDVELENVEKQRYLKNNILGASNEQQQQQKFTPKLQMKSHQSESNLRLTAIRYDNNNNSNNGQTNPKLKHYKRAPKP